jgi:predicted CoA-substrate-specific enzyme activase
VAGSGYLGVDVGSVSTNLVLIDDRGVLQEKIYLRTQGDPISAVKEGMRHLEAVAGDIEILGVGTSGSGRKLAGVILGADCVKNEITAHAVAANRRVPGVQTVIEIGGQDSKIIILRQGIVIDFAMNTVCAAGTGSFLEQQAARLGIAIDQFGKLALGAVTPVRIAGRCAVFAESDMIHKQQMGHRIEDIISGLCEALVENHYTAIFVIAPYITACVFCELCKELGSKTAEISCENQVIHVRRESGVSYMPQKCVASSRRHSSA